jgi:hypothetical protein
MPDDNDEFRGEPPVTVRRLIEILSALPEHRKDDRIVMMDQGDWRYLDPRPNIEYASNRVVLELGRYD